MPIDAYGGIIGIYADYTGIDWFRDWNASYNYPPGDGRPANKMWTVGKFNDRVDGPPSSNDTSRDSIDAIFAYEWPIIARLIRGGYTGQYWEIGNEPNYKPQFEPMDYAYQYNLYCTAIKSLDQSAKCLPGGLLLYGSNWRLWLRRFLMDYQKLTNITAPIDAWSIHPYSVWYTSSAVQTTSKIVEFRQLVNSMGIDRPIWITEFGYPGPDQQDEEELVNYINDVCAWLNRNRAAYGIERWFWFQYSQAGPNGIFAGQPFDRETVTRAGDAYLRQAGLIYVDAAYQADATRQPGSMRNPYRTVEAAIAEARPGDVIYSFDEGKIVYTMPFTAYLPVVTK